MHVVNARDGTRIVCHENGDGPPLVLVHGSGGAAPRWAPVLASLCQHFKVYSMDRRGRGASGDSAEYALEREIEDVASVVTAIPGEVNLLGHSFGGVCALEAARHATNLRSLILYEPAPPAPGVAHYPEGFIDRLEMHVSKGELEFAAEAFMVEVVRMPRETIERIKAQPAWSARLATVHTLPREFRAMEKHRIEPSRFAALDVPTLLLLGGDSPARFRSSMDVVSAALPRSTLKMLPGQQHNAMDTAPPVFVRAVTEFIQGID